MVTICWAVKGGSGTTVVSAALALSSDAPSLLVDLDGELPAVLGTPEPDRPGVGDWLDADVAADQLGELLVPIAPQCWLLPWSNGRLDVDHRGPRDERWAQLGTWLHDWAERWNCHVVVDGGTRLPPSALVEHARRTLLVTRPCYLALRRAVAAPFRPTGVVLVDEPGRGLRARDVEHALGAPVEATVRVDPAIARAVDAGLLASRLPRVVSRELRRAAA